MSDSQTPATFLAPEISTLAPLFPGYEIEILIATGGMGAVYRAVQKSLDRIVAIKILPREFSNDAAFCAGFEAEAKAMARLNHPNLIGVYDFGEVDGMLYIIMEYVPGKSLFHSAHGIAIDPGEVIRLVTGICDGLAHAHENGILHRDIKPSNILLDLNAQPKIGDFGLARPVERKIEEGEEIFGTPHYTAPEVVNSPQSVGYRADIFSVGVLLHELLTGRLPADDSRPASVIANCDLRFDAIIRKATNPVPELRYASAAEIAKDLKIIADSNKTKTGRLPVTNAPPRPVVKRPVHKPVKKSSSVPGIVMLILAIGISAASYKIIRKKLDTPQVVVVSPEVEEKKPAVTSTTPTTQIPLPDSNTSNSLPGYNPDTKDLTPRPKPDVNMEDDDDTSDSADNAKEIPAEPKFDVTGFFTRARKIMQDKAAPLISTHKENLAKNLAEYDRGLKRIIRKIDSRYQRDNAELDLEEFISACKENGNRIPLKPAAKIAYFRDVRAVHSENLEKQDAIDESLKQALTQLSATYILGLEKQNERLRATNDPAAIDLIKDEIEKTRDDSDYFPNLMLGESAP